LGKDRRRSTDRSRSRRRNLGKDRRMRRDRSRSRDWMKKTERGAVTEIEAEQ
jgi:hypothetical protein